jgi:hypothetical protein
MGFAFARRRSQRAAGASFAFAVLYKLWPLVLIPTFVGRDRRRLLRWFLVVGGLGVLGWAIVGGPGGMQQVLTFRDAQGWQIESTPGVISWIAGSEPFFDQGSLRVGHVELATRIGLTAILLVGLASTWRRTRSCPDPAGTPALSAVAILLVASPLFSAQYVTWLLPWAAVALVVDDDPPAGLLTVAICLLTNIEFVLLFLRQAPVPLTPDETAVAQGAILLRNLLCGWLWLRSVIGQVPRTPLGF